MSLDWFPGQKCTLKEPVSFFTHVAMRLNEIPVPRFALVYTVAGAESCADCGAHISLKELDGVTWYPAPWFRPVDSQAMEVLRGLLTPEGGMPAKKQDAVPDPVKAG
jgi:hypothetical protein